MYHVKRYVRIAAFGDGQEKRGGGLATAPQIFHPEPDQAVLAWVAANWRSNSGLISDRLNRWA